MSDNKPSPISVAAATDVSEFFTDLDGGIFERKLSIALSQVAAACGACGRRRIRPKRFSAWIERIRD